MQSCHGIRNRIPCPMRLAVVLLCSFAARGALAQLTDVTQTPNAANEGIKKTLSQEVGAGRGDVLTPDSSLFLIGRDPFRAIRRGRQIFQRKFTVSQGFGPRTGDGIGDIASDASVGAGLVDSCAGCHARPRGSAGAGGDVFTRPDSRDAPHLFGLGLVEMLGDEITTDLRAIRAAALRKAQATGSAVTGRLASKGIDYGTITARPDGTFDVSAVAGVDADLRVKPFFAQGKAISIREFLVGAFKAEMGLQSVDPDLDAAAIDHRDVVTPSGMVLTGTQDTFDPAPAHSANEDPDGDGVANEISTSVVDDMEFYLLNYFRPAVSEETSATASGRRTFRHLGCATCHVQDLTIDHDRRVADVATAFDATNGIFNRLYATATAKTVETDDHTGFPTLKVPAGGPFVVEGIFADFRRHDLGPAFHERNFDGTTTTLFMTEPLWGVGSTAPYGHDGRSINLTEVILRHGGEAQAARDAFAALPDARKRDVLAFLESLVLFPPDDTASNLDPGNPATLGFPQFGHGSIRLGALFDDPTDPE